MTGAAAIYTRMSHVLDDDQTKVDDQERRCRELAAARGVEVAGVYCDNNRSAWQPNRQRPEWDRMLADVDAGRVNAIIVYHGDRLIRQPWDLAKLLQLARGKGIRLYSPSGDRDLDSDDDQFVLEIEAAMAKRESANISRRKKAQYERMRRQGMIRHGGRGGRAFGYQPDNLTEVPAEIDALRLMARQALGGASGHGIARGLNAAGMLTPSGKEWAQQSVHAVLTSPRIAGLMPDGESEAAWKPVISRQEWEQVTMTLAVRSGANPAPTNARAWLLSGIAACHCGLPVKTNKRARSGATSYVCPDGHVRRNAAHLDAYVLGAVAGQLANDANPGPSAAAATHAAEWAALDAEQREAQVLAGDYAGSAGRLRIIMKRLDAIEARMAELREAEDTSAGDRLRGKYAGATAAELRGLTLDVRRALVAATVTVEVLPAARRGGPGFDPAGVRVLPLPR